MLGWTLPSSIPVSGFDGNSLTGKFIGSMFTELGHFPVRGRPPGQSHLTPYPPQSDQSP